ncbi:MAG TPA: hypothetical protein VK633_09490, partial [Verrucomicrobiae bacterium]|nr:hypothetical protein [Verrucomicrobiae bacterium]
MTQTPLSIRLLFASSALAFGADNKPAAKPRHDSPEQLFRRAPMAESARSVAVNLSTNLHYAFDADTARIHTVWEGSSLNLWGPPYSYSKTPFICDFDGKTLFSFPPISPWFSTQKSLPTRFRSIETSEDADVIFSYDLLSPEVVRVKEWATGSAQNDRWTIHRNFLFPSGTVEDLSYLLFAEGGAHAEKTPLGYQVTSTNGTFSIHAALSTGAEAKVSLLTEEVSYRAERITEDGTENGNPWVDRSGNELRLYASVSAQREKPLRLEITFSHGDLADSPKERLRSPSQKVNYNAGPERRAPSGDESYKIEHFPLPPEAELMITGMDWLPDGRLAVCTWLGEVYIISNLAGDPALARFTRFARGLNEPLGLTVSGNNIFVVQKGELTRLLDSNEDGECDRYECVNSAWGYSGNYHSYSFGPAITAQKDFYVFITGQRGRYDLAYQGWALRISADGETITPFCSGLRVPHGWGLFGPNHDLFTTDNQGNWIGACKLNHLQEGKFYGFPSSKPATREPHQAAEVEPPVIWLPRSLSPSTSGFDTIRDARFGPFTGQLMIGDFQNSIVMRAVLEQVDGKWQGAVFPFAKGLLSGVNRLLMGLDGKLYVGGGKRTWSTAAPKEYSLDRVAYTGTLPFEVQEVRATPTGFDL